MMTSKRVKIDRDTPIFALLTDLGKSPRGESVNLFLNHPGEF